MIMIHDKFQYKTRFTQKDVEVFSDLTGDKNPIHLNRTFAEKSEYGRQIVQGMLIATAFSKVFGTMWPGEDSIYISQDILFISPVYVETDYILNFECENVDRERKIGTIKASLVNDSGVELVKLKAKIKSSFHFSNPNLN